MRTNLSNLFSIHIEIEGALNLESKLWWKDYVKDVDIWDSGIVLTTITIVITIVSRAECCFAEGLVHHRFWKAATPRNHEIFEPASLDN